MNKLDHKHSLSKMFLKAQTFFSLFIYTHTSQSHKKKNTHTHTHFPLAVLLCFVRINEKSSLALGVISVLGVK